MEVACVRSGQITPRCMSNDYFVLAAALRIAQEGRSRDNFDIIKIFFYLVAQVFAITPPALPLLPARPRRQRHS